MVVDGKLFARRIKAKNTISLVDRDVERDRPESVRGATTRDKDSIVLQNLDIVARKDGNTVVVAELS
jgi:hypothetical protein